MDRIDAGSIVFTPALLSKQPLAWTRRVAMRSRSGSAKVPSAPSHFAKPGSEVRLIFAPGANNHSYSGHDSRSSEGLVRVDHSGSGLVVKLNHSSQRNIRGERAGENGTGTRAHDQIEAGPDVKGRAPSFLAEAVSQ
jgi:hypothetical protein